MRKILLSLFCFAAAQTAFGEGKPLYEQGAGQHIPKENTRLPALSCLPLRSSRSWKENLPKTSVKFPGQMADDNLVPMGDGTGVSGPPSVAELGIYREKR